jgi:hypothetical protein
VPIAISAEQRALAASIREWAEHRAGHAVYAFLLSRCLSIAGGTSQILLSVVAERALGLPRDEAR